MSRIKLANTPSYALHSVLEIHGFKHTDITKNFKGVLPNVTTAAITRDTAKNAVKRVTGNSREFVSRKRTYGQQAKDQFGVFDHLELSADGYIIIYSLMH